MEIQLSFITWRHFISVLRYPMCNRVFLHINYMPGKVSLTIRCAIEYFLHINYMPGKVSLTIYFLKCRDALRTDI